MKPNTEMNHWAFMKAISKYAGAEAHLITLVARAKAEGYANGFDAGFSNASESNDMYQYGE